MVLHRSVLLVAVAAGLVVGYGAERAVAQTVGMPRFSYPVVLVT